ncbi:MAG TPA: hypothetical protein DCZ72_13925, partial [Armatimonadetes bacterium]|nr:hypothetical protein [Armatimonadota bacterium]
MLADLQLNDFVAELPVFVVEASARTKKDGAPFASYVVRDRSAEVGAVYWEGGPGPNDAGRVAVVEARMGEFRGDPQLTITRIEFVDEPSADLLDRLRAGHDRALQAELVEVLRDCRRDLPPLFWAIFEAALRADPFDLSGPFWQYAAGRSKHHTGPGELAWHILTMLRLVDGLAPAYPGLDADLVRLAVLCHDLGKLDTYEMTMAGAYYLPREQTVGHTFYSMARVSAAIAALRAQGQEIDPSDEENLLHCLASHHGRREYQAVAEPATPEAHALHALDLLDSRLRETDERVAA